MISELEMVLGWLKDDIERNERYYTIYNDISQRISNKFAAEYLSADVPKRFGELAGQKFLYNLLSNEKVYHSVVKE